MLSGKSKSSSLTSSPARHPMSVCGDCGSGSPSWASVNRGILLCAECCSVHRSMGRHISQVNNLNGSKVTKTNGYLSTNMIANLNL